MKIYNLKNVMHQLNNNVKENNPDSKAALDNNPALVSEFTNLHSSERGFL